jgi:hypothetical protein
MMAEVCGLGWERHNKSRVFVLNLYINLCWDPHEYLPLLLPAPQLLDAQRVEDLARLHTLASRVNAQVCAHSSHHSFMGTLISENGAVLTEHG